MKKIYTIFLAVLLTASLFAQSPQKMSYQAVIRENDNVLVKSHAVGMRVSILEGTTPVYVETHTTTTNANGLVTIEIGGGTFVSGVAFSAIDWSAGEYSIKTETDPTGGTNYTAIVGTSQLLSVPYALYAKTAEGISGTITASKVSDFQTSVTNNTAVLFNTAKNSYPSFDQTKLAAITGTNTGDETTSTIKTKLGITTLSGSNTGDQTLAGLGGVASNTPITGATKTKITYDTKGLVTAGTDATTADIAASTDKNYVTDAQLTVIGNTSGTNTGDNVVNTLYSGLVTNATHTGDVTGSEALTLATVNSNVGTFNNITINAKGLATAGSNVSYVTSETDPTVKAINGIVKSNGTTISAATAGTDYLTPAGSAALLTNFPVLNQNTSGSAASFTGSLAGEVTGTQGATIVGNSAVLGKVLTGYVSGAGTVAATDNILQAIQKLNGNNATNAILTGMVTSVGNTTTVVTNANLTGEVTSSGNTTTIANKITMTATAPVSITGSPNVIASGAVAISIAAATPSTAGSMSAADKIKLDGIATPTHIIGESYGGGIIFYLDASGQHGLVAATTDQSTGIQWYNGSNTNTTAFASSVGAGDGNTSMIVYNQGTGTYAAQQCYDSNTGGYYDWYLPSKYELNLMYQNIGQGNLLGLGNVGSFASSHYWSSTENNSNDAWTQNFNNGGQYIPYKSDTFYVRAVRAF